MAERQYKYVKGNGKEFLSTYIDKIILEKYKIILHMTGESITGDLQKYMRNKIRRIGNNKLRELINAYEELTKEENSPDQAA